MHFRPPLCAPLHQSPEFLQAKDWLYLPPPVCHLWWVLLFFLLFLLYFHCRLHNSTILSVPHRLAAWPFVLFWLAWKPRHTGLINGRTPGSKIGLEFFFQRSNRFIASFEHHLLIVFNQRLYHFTTLKLHGLCNGSRKVDVPLFTFLSFNELNFCRISQNSYI